MRYFFDLTGEDPDDTGAELPGIAEVQPAAVRALLEAAIERPARLSTHPLHLKVRDPSGRTVLTASLNIALDFQDR